MYSNMSLFQGVEIDRFHCIERCSRFRDLEEKCHLSSTVHRAALISGVLVTGVLISGVWFPEVPSFQVYGGQCSGWSVRNRITGVKSNITYYVSSLKPLTKCSLLNAKLVNVKKGEK